MATPAQVALAATATALAISVFRSDARGEAQKSAPKPSGARPGINPDRVAAVYEPKLRTVSGWRLAVVMLDDGRSVQSDRPIEQWAHHGWVKFSTATFPSLRALVNPEKVVTISESNFRRTDRFDRDTVIELAGGEYLVVEESIDEVRRKIGVSR